VDRRQFIQGTSLLAIAPELHKLRGQTSDTRPQWLHDFEKPPNSARPWAYAFWMEGNITKEGISGDLSAMEDAGVGGMIFMDGGLGNPLGRFVKAGISGLDAASVGPCKLGCG
jgi:hypothetical protein